MSFGFLLGILVRVCILYYKSVKEPVYLQYTHLLLFGFFKKNLGIKSMCVPTENVSLGTYVFHGFL